MMRVPVITGIIKRRLLVNFRADAETVRQILPAPFRPKLHNGSAVIGVCLIRLEQIRPAGWPAFLGVASENAAHRIAVEWPDAQGKWREGVFIPRRDTGSWLNLLMGGRVFPGEHHHARFEVAESGERIDLRMESRDHAVQVRVVGEKAEALPADSCFQSLAEAPKFFEAGAVGYSVTREPDRYDGLQLRMKDWQVMPLSVTAVQSTYFSDRRLFPEGTVTFDHALLMRNLAHEWHQEADLYGDARCCA
jgi:hypothetical protein